VNFSLNLTSHLTNLTSPHTKPHTRCSVTGLPGGAYPAPAGGITVQSSPQEQQARWASRAVAPWAAPLGGTVAARRHGTTPPPPETTAPPPPETTPPGPTCPPDALDVAARRDWAAFQSAAAAATGPDEFALLLELGAGRP